MEDFPGHTTSPLPVLTPPTEPLPAEEEVLLLEGPPNPHELQIVDPSHDSSLRKEERRKEKKRKGKLLTQPKPKKSTGQRKGGDQELTEEGRGQKRKRQETAEAGQPQYEMLTAELDKEVILQLNKFDDPKLQEECDGRLTGGKKIKSGKMLHRLSLRTLGAEEKFLEYITGIGFEWLLEFNNSHVPVALAQEFFTSFRLKSTTDVEEKSISFRIFGRDIRMSLTEWSVRLGLYKEEQAAEGAWSRRDIGPPRNNVEFNPQAAWSAITHHRAPAYKSTQSRGYHIEDPILRLAQVYLGYNLLGQANTSNTITQAELYWIAHTCHTIANHPVRHLNVCHLLGEFVRRNFKVIYRVPPPPRCPAPEKFDIQFFLRVRILKEVKGELHFYEVGVPDMPSIFGGLPAPKEKDDVAPGTTEEKDAWRVRVEAMIGKLVESSLA